MIKVIIERQIKEGENLSPLLRELRAAAMHQPGYITGETLISTEDKSIIITISIWHSLEDWKAWAASETRARLYQQIEPLLVEKPKVRTYQIMATEGRTG
jgi:quinol monooxygenase YgiN